MAMVGGKLCVELIFYYGGREKLGKVNSEH
jgi:hypothetical protein